MSRLRTLCAVLVVGALLLGAASFATVFAGNEDSITPATSDQPEPPASTGDLQIPYGQTASLDADALQLTFVGVDEDSRCPREVMCVWQGRAVIRLTAVLNGADQGEVLLTTTVLPGKSPSTADAAVGPFTLHLIGMTPYPSTSQKVALEQYVALLRVTRA
jgi:hypothetical protein